jgi:hypothetical protein
MRRVALVVAILSTGLPGLAAGDSLKELVDRADLALRGHQTSASVFEMKIKTESYTREFKIVAWDDLRQVERSLIKILGPALWRGFGTLKVGSQLKLYNPRTNHVTVVGQSMLGDSWMGSHFTNDDLVKETKLARHFDLRLIKKWRAPHESLGTGEFHRVLLTPKATAPVAWDKVIFLLWQGSDQVLPVRVEYFRKAAATRPDRWLSFSSIRQLGGRMLPAELKIELARKPGEYTKITYQALRFDVAVPPSKFSEQALRH